MRVQHVSIRMAPQLLKVSLAVSYDLINNDMIIHRAMVQ